MKIYRDGGAFAHDGQDVVAAFDVFKITRHGGTGSAARWKVHALTPWARDMMATKSAYQIMLREGGGPTRALNDMTSNTIAQTGVSFSRKRDAVSFCEAIANMAEKRSAERERRPTVYVVTMETHTFSWVAVGETRDRAIDGLADAMRDHRRQYEPYTWHPSSYPGPHNNDGPAEYPADDAAWLRWLIVDYYGASIVELPMGGGARDGETISS